MKDAPGSSHKSCYLYCRPVAVSRWRGNPSAHGSPPPHRKTSCRRRNSVGPSAARSTKDNSVLWPDTLSAPVTLTALTGPFPPAGGSARARRSRILHASPELRWSSQSRARGKERSLRSASFPARLRHASASSARFVSICGIRVCCQVSFPPLQAALTASVQSIALTRPLQPAGGPSVVPSVDSSHAPPCCAGSSG